MDISLDNFLGGQLRIYQPVKGYRAGTDSVILAACIKTKKDLKILDVGSGVGVISYCIGFRCSNINITGIEKNINYYSLAIKSLKFNKLNSKINFINKNFQDLHDFNSDIIVSNPPWFNKSSTYLSDNNLINEAKIESLDLELWVSQVSKNLHQNGEYYTIFPFIRVEEIVKIMKNYFNIIKIYPITSFQNHAPDRAIIYAKKANTKYTLIKSDNIIIHKPDKSFMDNIYRVLREGSSLTLA